MAAVPQDLAQHGFTQQHLATASFLGLSATDIFNFITSQGPAAVAIIKAFLDLIGSKKQPQAAPKGP